MSQFTEQPFGRVKYKVAFDARWPSWIEGDFSAKMVYFKNPEIQEPSIEHSFHRPHVFKNTDGGKWMFQLMDKVSVISLTFDGNRLGELWLRRCFRSPSDILKPSFYAELYKYGEIHTDRLTSETEETGYRYKIERTVWRNFDVFVHISPKENSFQINRSHWQLNFSKLKP